MTVLYWHDKAVQLVKEKASLKAAIIVSLLATRYVEGSECGAARNILLESLGMTCKEFFKKYDKDRS